MKTHAIIPIFIPHLGCPNTCAFCNQHKIAKSVGLPSSKEVVEAIEMHLITLRNRPVKTIEVAFYGGSFTGIPTEQQNEYLEIAAFYKRNGVIDKIHLSTRPDYISDEILDNLKEFGVDVIELGAQSFDEEVLRLSERGHNSRSIYESGQIIKANGFELGLQLMIGLPGDTLEKSVYSAKELVRVGPSVARIYPIIVIEGTKLHEMYLQGEYLPPSLDESVAIAKEMFKIISAAGIRIIRMGLQNASEVSANLMQGKNYHPAFRQLVEGELAKDALEEQLLTDTALANHIAKMRSHTETAKVSFLPCIPISFKCNERSLSSMIGNRRKNRLYFEAKYPLFRISYEVDNSLADYQYIVVK